MSDQTAIPETLVIVPHDGGQPDVTVDGIGPLASTDRRIRTFFFNEIRNPDSRFRTAPTGFLYTATGAHRLDVVFEAMWTCPESEALRLVPTGGSKYREPHLTTQERADAAYRRIWAEFRATLTATDQEMTR